MATETKNKQADVGKFLLSTAFHIYKAESKEQKALKIRFTSEKQNGLLNAHI